MTAAGVCLLAPLAPQIAAALPDCLFHAITGLPCPTCGATRALLALSHLDLAGAAAMNPLAVLGAAGFVLGGFAAGIAALTGRSLKAPVFPCGPSALSHSSRWPRIGSGCSCTRLDDPRRSRCLRYPE